MKKTLAFLLLFSLPVLAQQGPGRIPNELPPLFPNRAPLNPKQQKPTRAVPNPTPQKLVGTLSVTPKDGWSVWFVDNQESDVPAVNAIDGDSATLWATQWKTVAPDYPHEIQINMGQVHAISGFEYIPRQDGVNRGNVLNYEFYISSDGKDWGQPVATGTFDASSTKKMVTLSNPTTIAGQFFRFRGLGEVEGNPWMVVAELNIIEGTLPQYATVHVLPQNGDKSNIEPLASRTTAMSANSPFCNQPDVPPPTEGSVLNPTIAIFNDPYHANRVCKVSLPQDVLFADTYRIVVLFRADPLNPGDPDNVSPRSNIGIPQPWFRDSMLPPPPVPAAVRILP